MCVCVYVCCRACHMPFGDSISVAGGDVRWPRGSLRMARRMARRFCSGRSGSVGSHLRGHSGPTPGVLLCHPLCTESFGDKGPPCPCRPGPCQLRGQTCFQWTRCVGSGRTEAAVTSLHPDPLVPCCHHPDIPHGPRTGQLTPSPGIGKSRVP